jgi:cell division control protein 6
MFESASNQTRSGLFQSEAPLTTGYTPPHPVNREQERDRLNDAVRPLAYGRQPENLLLYGPAGTGKTLLVEHVLRDLNEETRVATAQINCWQYNTRPALLTELLIQLGYPAPRKGKPVDALVTKLQEWLDKQHSTVVALDEFDQLTDQATVVYDLQEVSAAAEHPLGLLLISNQPPGYLGMDPRSQSRLSYRTLEVQPYTKQALIEIPHQRVDDAFHPETIMDYVINQAAATVAAKNG